MNVASIELCKELYELSEWQGGEYDYCRNKGEEWDAWNQSDQHERSYPGFERSVPAYDLGYLLRQFPQNIATYVYNAFDENGHLHWRASDGVIDFIKPKFEATADTPEDAVAKLAIELFKQGVLTRGGDE